MACFIVVTVLWIFSVCLHEFGHAAVAYLGGDHTVRDKGYLTMNPLHYTHPVYSLLMPVVFMIMGGIGLPGGAVYIERHLLRSRAWDTWVSLAGVGMNILQVFFISLVFRLGLLTNDPQSLASVSIAFLLELEIGSIFLNLIPVPPLDGFQAIAPWLPLETRQRLFAMSNVGIWIVFLALWYIQPLNEAFWRLVHTLMVLLGVDPYLGYVGYHAFRFWEHQ
jgi:Zn-dependent protease